MVDIRLSKSKVLDYIKCPRMFYFKHCTTFGKNKQQTSPEMENGTMLHEIFEAYNSNRNKFDQYYQFVKGNDIFEQNIFGFFKLLDYYNINRACYSELEVYSEDINVFGYIDAIYYVPEGTETMAYVNRKKSEIEAGVPEYMPYTLTKDEYWLVDYKTGKYHPYDNSNNMLELYIYEHLANEFLKNNHEGTIDRIGFFFTKFPEVKFMKPVTSTERNRAKKKFNSVVTNIKNDEFTQVSNKLCDWCAFKGICDQYHDDMVKELNDHVLMVV